VRYSLDELPGSYKETIQLLKAQLASKNYDLLSVCAPFDWSQDERVGPYMEFANPYSGRLYAFIYMDGGDRLCIVEQSPEDGSYYYPQLDDKNLDSRYDYLVKKITTP
jgi:hypothetical protein